MADAVAANAARAANRVEESIVSCLFVTVDDSNVEMLECAVLIVLGLVEELLCCLSLVGTIKSTYIPRDHVLPIEGPRPLKRSAFSFRGPELC